MSPSPRLSINTAIRLTAHQENPHTMTPSLRLNINTDVSLLDGIRESQEASRGLPPATRSPIQLFSGDADPPKTLESPIIVWMTACPHTTNSRPSGGTHLVLVSRDYADLRRAQRNLRKPREDYQSHLFNRQHRGRLLRARETILQKRIKQMDFLPRMEARCLIPPKTGKEARKLDDQEEKRIADAFADHFPNELPPTLEEDLHFNAFCRNPVLHESNQFRWPVFFRAMVPADWRGLSPYPADEHQVHILELTDKVIEDLCILWHRAWDCEWPEADILQRTDSCSSRYEIESPRERSTRPEQPRPAERARRPRPKVSTTANVDSSGSKTETETETETARNTKKKTEKKTLKENRKGLLRRAESIGKSASGGYKRLASRIHRWVATTSERRARMAAKIEHG